MINKRIAALYEENRHLFEGKPVAFDGVVNEEEFLNAKIRTTFLLKEVNYPDMTDDWTDYLDSLDRGAPVSETNNSLYKTWHNVCLWIELLNNPECSFADCLTSDGRYDEKRLRKNLKQTSIVNLKKTGGGGSSNWNEIKAATEKCAEFITGELNTIPSNLVICGGTYEFAKILFPKEIKNEKMLPSGAWYFVADNKIYLNFPHPMWYSVNRNILFAYAKEVFKDLIREGLL